MKKVVDSVRVKVDQALNELGVHNRRGMETRMALTKIEHQVNLLRQKRELLRKAIQDHESKGPDAVISVPFTFFNELHKDHTRLLDALAKKITETENLAKEIFSQSSASPASQP
jgi:hypothetical protein